MIALWYANCLMTGVRGKKCALSYRQQQAAASLIGRLMWDRRRAEKEDKSEMSIVEVLPREEEIKKRERRQKRNKEKET
ncbi:unnamed protein product [Dibothriocephalus latus]|uniref:Uncharacterized protein n=1 Tax=Dibothriocephalus latus TaxID=60516 RepID=A0A3P7LX73_DIBLA|nr:unnamed protein product [Dibothriocephalus latus]